MDVRVLVTGHQGYIGSVMVPMLRAAGHDVRGLDVGWFADRVHGPTPDDGDTLRVDLREVEREHLAGVDAIVHLAALSNDPLGDLEPERTYDINHHASVRLAEMAREAGVGRFLYSSSCSVYGAADTGTAVDESAPLHPVTPYAISKIRVEDDLHALADDRFSPVHLRNATAYGWSPRLRLDLVLNDFVATAHLTGTVRVLSDGTPWRPLVHVSDICRAFLAALTAPQDVVHDRAFNVGSSVDNHRIGDLAELVAEVCDADVEITGEVGADARTYRVDFSRIHAELPGFEVHRDARQGAEELRDRFREHGLTPAQHASTYRRLPVLRELRDRGIVDGHLRVVGA